MGNTQLRILEQMAMMRGLTATAIAIRLWPKSKQIDKKTKTINAHLKKILKAGWADRDAEYRYCITPVGRNATATAQQQRDKEWRDALLKTPTRLKSSVQPDRPRDESSRPSFTGFPRLAQ